MSNFYPDLKGKAALILGASRGIGASVATALVSAGARVVLSSRDVPALEALAASLKTQGEVHVVKADLANPDSVREAVATAVKKLGRLDIAVNNGGVTQKRAEFADTPDESYDSIFDINVRGVFIAMKAEIQAMLASGGGSIVNTGSISSTIGLKNMALYTASKHALAGLSKVAALDYGRKNIRVNVLAPGAVLTEMTRGGAAATAEGRAAVDAATPLGRFAEPDEMAGAVLWLCSSASSYVTGAIIQVDGGYTVG